MSNITNLNRDYLIKINVKEATIDVPKMTFWNTDKKTSNMFVQLVINMSENELIENYVTIENATDYKITLNVIKPKTNQYRTFEATLLNEEKALFEIDLTSEFIDQVGNYNFEFEVSSKVDNNDESITTSSSTYEVKGSILTNLNEEISSSPDLPILKQLIEQVKQLQGGDLTDYQKKNDAAQKTIVEDGKLYLTKLDGTKLDDGTTLPTGSGTSIDDTNTTTDKTWSSSKIDSQFKDIAKKVENIGQPTQQQINTAIDKAIEEGKITGSGSINSTAKTLLETILQNAVYTSDQSSNITALISALGSNESGGGDTPTVKTYTITNTLTHCSNSNTSTSIDENSSYVATITPVDGYTLTDASVNITMGEVDVTSTVYNSGSINIPSVTGNIVISVSAIIIPSTPTFTALTPTMLARPLTDKMLYYYLFDNVESIDTSDTSKISQNASWRYGVYDCSNLSTVTIKRKVNKKGYSGSDVFLAFNQFPTMYTYNADATQVGTTDVCYKAFNLPPTGYDNSINVGDILEYELTINADYPYIVSVLSGTKNESSTDINDYIDENGYINFTTGTIDPLIVGIKE